MSALGAKQAAQAAGAEEVVFEYAHGDARIKDAQMELMAKIESSDTIIVTEVTRLSRSVQQLCEIITQIRDRQLRLVILDSITVDCRNGRIDPMSQAFLQMDECGVCGAGACDHEGARQEWHGQRQS